MFFRGWSDGTHENGALSPGEPHAAANIINWAIQPSETHSRAVETVCFAAKYAQELGDKVTEQHWQARILCDVLGKHDRLPQIHPHWLTSIVVDLATAIYNDRAFDRLPILADALMDAGCDNEALIAHCRSKGPHVRGCWLVDLILGKE
jgi:hypothetical protein